MTTPRRLGPARQPYDALNGLRVGGLAGALLGAVGALITGLAVLILAGAVLGSAVGFLTERRALHRSAPDDDGPLKP